MAINIWKVKKVAAMFSCFALPMVTYVFAVPFAGMVWGTLLTVVVAIGSVPLANRMMDHPILRMLDGAGILTLTVDSTGVIDSFVVGVKPPEMIYADKDKSMNQTFFDRRLFSYFRFPRPASVVKVTKDNLQEMGVESAPADFTGKDGYFYIRVPEDAGTEKLFRFEHLPCFLYNRQTKSFLTKEFLAKGEKETMFNHQVLDLSAKIKDTSRYIRDFARHTVDLLRPARQLGGLWWVFILLVLALVAWLGWQYFTGGA